MPPNDHRAFDVQMIFEYSRFRRATTSERKLKKKSSQVLFRFISFLIGKSRIGIDCSPFFHGWAGMRAGSVSARFHRNQEVSVQPRNRFLRSVDEQEKRLAVIIRDNYYSREHLDRYHTLRLSRSPIEIYRQLNKGTITNRSSLNLFKFFATYRKRYIPLFFFFFFLFHHVRDYRVEFSFLFEKRDISARWSLIVSYPRSTKEESVVESEISIAGRIGVARDE